MHEMLEGLLILLLALDEVPQDQKYLSVVFAVGYAILGTLVLVADFSYWMIKRLGSAEPSVQSLLGLSHGLLPTPLYFVAWGLGALVIGYFSYVANIFQVRVIACVAVGVSWPIVFAELLKRFQQQGQQGAGG